MRTFIRKITLFTSILLLVLILMNHWMDQELNPHYPLQYDELFHPKVNADVIILGASPATHGINPKYLETDHLKVFNFALNGASPAFNLRWYQRIFRSHYRKPSYVIYGVHWVMFDGQFLKRRFEQDSKYFPFDVFVKEMRDLRTLKGLLLNRFAFIRERKQLMSRVVQLFKRQHEEVFLKSGYYQGYIPFETKRDLSEEVVNARIEESQLRAFEELLDEFERDGVKVIFVEVPGYLYGFDSSTLSENIKLLKKIAEERKIPFLDYETKRTTAINTNPALFSDSAHLNGKGSEAFSQLLKKDLDGLLN